MDQANSEFDDRIRFFLAQVIEISEKIQTQLAEHSEERDATVVLYQQRRDLFEHAGDDIQRWIKECELGPAVPWQVYKNFMLELEKVQDERKYAASSAGVADAGNVRLEDNPFLVQRDEISDKEEVDRMIVQRRMTANDLIDLMTNITAGQMADMFRLSREVSSGDMWEHDYDL